MWMMKCRCCGYDSMWMGEVGAVDVSETASALHLDLECVGLNIPEAQLRLLRLEVSCLAKGQYAQREADLHQPLPYPLLHPSPAQPLILEVPKVPR